MAIEFLVSLALTILAIALITYLILGSIPWTPFVIAVVVGTLITWKGGQDT